MEAEKSHGVPSASLRTKENSGVLQSDPQDLRTRRAYGVKLRLRPSPEILGLEVGVLVYVLVSKGLTT